MYSDHFTQYSQHLCKTTIFHCHSVISDLHDFYTGTDQCFILYPNQSLHVYYILNTECLYINIYCIHTSLEYCKIHFESNLTVEPDRGVIGSFEYVIWIWNMSVNWLGIIFTFVLMTEFDHWKKIIIYILFYLRKVLNWWYVTRYENVVLTLPTHLSTFRMPITTSHIEVPSVNMNLKCATVLSQWWAASWSGTDVSIMC